MNPHPSSLIPPGDDTAEVIIHEDAHLEAIERDGEIIIDEVIDIEVYVREQKTVPLARAYRIRIDKPYYVVETPKMSGRDILLLAGKKPPEDYVLRQILHGQPVKVDLDAVVDFRTPGVEKFKTMLKTAQDGAR